MTLLFSYLSTFVEFLSIYTAVHILLKKKFIPTQNDISFAIFIVAVLGTIPSEYGLTLLLVGQFSYILYIFHTYTKNLVQTLTLYSLTLIFVMLSQTAIVLIISILGIYSTSVFAGTIYSVLSLLFLFVMLLFTPLKNLYTLVISSSLPAKLILINTYLVYFNVVLAFKTNNMKIYSNPAYLFSVVTLLISANICILYYERNLQYQKQILDSYEKNLPIYESLISEIRSRQHEYSNRLQSLQTLIITCGDYDSLRNSLNKYTQEYSRPLHAYPLLQINMPLLAASLYSLSERAVRNNITVHFDVVSEALSSNAPEYLLADMTSILTQNAIEACNPGDYIYVHISCIDSKVHFEIRNPVDKMYSQKEILKFFEKGYTTKKHTSKVDGTPHGLGLYTLHSALYKYDGTVGGECIEFENMYWMIFRLII